MDLSKDRLRIEVAVAGAFGALAAIELHWNIARTGTLPLATSRTWWAAKYLFTVLLHSGTLIGELIGFVVADSMRLDKGWRGAAAYGAGIFGSAAVFALTWFMLRTGAGNLRWRRVVTVLGWVLWIALAFQISALIDSRPD